MSEEWKTLAQQIADLKRQLVEERTARDRDLLKLEEMTADRNMWRAAYELQDLQRRTVKGDHHVH
jgi:hypothetical protein